MIEHLNTINALASQIDAILDLLIGADNCVDMESVNVSAEMCQTMMMELMTEVEKIENEWRSGLDAEKQQVNQLIKRSSKSEQAE